MCVCLYILLWHWRQGGLSSCIWRVQQSCVGIQLTLNEVVKVAVPFSADVGAWNKHKTAFSLVLTRTSLFAVFKGAHALFRSFVSQYIRVVRVHCSLEFCLQSDAFSGSNHFFAHLLYCSMLVFPWKCNCTSCTRFAWAQ